MDDVIATWIEANFGGTVVVLIAIVSIAVWLGIWIGKLWKEIKGKPCAEHQKTLDRQLEKIDKDSELLHKIEGQLTSLTNVERRIEDINKTILMLASSNSFNSPLTQSQSPVSLTEKGREIVTELNLWDAIDANWSKISDIPRGEMNPYDIQMQFMAGFITEPEAYLEPATLESIKKDAFMRGLPLIDYMRMLGVMARDKYFREHGMDLAEIDKNDPTKK